MPPTVEYYMSNPNKTPPLEYCLLPSPHPVRLALSAVIGVVGGVLLVMSWWRFGSVMVCVVVVGLMLGFLIASTVLFTPLGMNILMCGPLKQIHRTKLWEEVQSLYILCVVTFLQVTLTCSGTRTWFSG